MKVRSWMSFDFSLNWECNYTLMTSNTIKEHGWVITLPRKLEDVITYHSNIITKEIYTHGPLLLMEISQTRRFTACIIIPPASTKLIGGYTGITLSVRLSVCGQNRVRSVSSTILIGSISYLHILSSNFRRCVACNARFKIQKFEILANFLNL